MFLVNKKMCSFYDDDDDTFRVGYLIDVDEEFAIFNIYTTRGYEDGLYLTRKDDIFRVDYENKYINRIIKLSELIDNKFDEMSLNISKSDLKKALLLYAKQSKIIVTLRLMTGDALTGFVCDINDEMLVLKVLDEDGILDGKSMLKTDSICRIWCNSGYERNVQLLNNNKNTGDGSLCSSSKPV